MQQNEKDIAPSGGSEEISIPVIQEQLSVDKKIIETGKVYVRKRVTEEKATVNLPLLNEGYDIKKVEVKKIVDTPPPVRYEGNTTIVPIVHEVLVIEKKYEVVEEVHIVKRKEEVPFTKEFILLNDHIEIERVPIDNKNDNQHTS